MKASLKYPVFYLAPEEHMVYVFWREEAVTTRRLLTEAGGWAGQEVVVLLVGIDEHGKNSSYRDDRGSFFAE
jgi:hypothetical protein